METTTTETGTKFITMYEDGYGHRTRLYWDGEITVIYEGQSWKSARKAMLEHAVTIAHVTGLRYDRVTGTRIEFASGAATEPCYACKTDTTKTACCPWCADQHPVCESCSQTTISETCRKIDEEDK